MTLQQLTSEIQSTPFYLAHQGPPVTHYVFICHSPCIHLSLTMYPPVTHYISGLNDREFMESLSQIFSVICPELQFISPHVRKPMEKEDLTRAQIRVAFISSYFYDHSIGRIMLDTLNYMRQDARVIVTVSHLRYPCVSVSFFFSLSFVLFSLPLFRPLVRLCVCMCVCLSVCLPVSS